MSEKKCEFKCLGSNCPNHCCGAYSGSASTLYPLGSIGFSEIILLPEDVKRLKNAGYDYLIQLSSDGISTIQTAPDGTCAALQEGRCKIYDARPAICHAYPLYLDMFVGVCALKECEAVSDDLCIGDYSEAFSNLLDIYQYWINIYKDRIKR